MVDWLVEINDCNIGYSNTPNKETIRLNQKQNFNYVQ